MSDNKLLTENTIRRFMKLANTEALSKSFLSEAVPSQTIEMEPMKITAKKPAAKVDLRKQVDQASADAKKAHGAKAAQKGREAFAKSINEEEELEENTEELEENLEDLEEQEEEEMEMDVELGAEDDMDAEPEMDEPEMDEPEMGQPEMGEADMSLTEEEAQLLISLGERLSAAIGEGADAPEMEEPEMEEPEMEEPEMEEDDEEAAYRMDEESLVNEVLKRVTKRLVAEKLKNRK